MVLSDVALVDVVLADIVLPHFVQSQADSKKVGTTVKTMNPNSMKYLRNSDKARVLVELELVDLCRKEARSNRSCIACTDRA